MRSRPAATPDGRASLCSEAPLPCTTATLHCHTVLSYRTVTHHFHTRIPYTSDIQHCHSPLPNGTAIHDLPITLVVHPLFFTKDKGALGRNAKEKRGKEEAMAQLVQQLASHGSPPSTQLLSFCIATTSLGAQQLPQRLGGRRRILTREFFGFSQKARARRQGDEEHRREDREGTSYGYSCHGSCHSPCHSPGLSPRL